MQFDLQSVGKGVFQYVHMCFCTENVGIWSSSPHCMVTLGVTRYPFIGLPVEHVPPRRSRLRYLPGPPRFNHEHELPKVTFWHFYCSCCCRTQLIVLVLSCVWCLRQLGSENWFDLYKTLVVLGGIRVKVAFCKSYLSRRLRLRTLSPPSRPKTSSIVLALLMSPPG